MDKCLNYQNNGYSGARLKKAKEIKNKIAHVFLQKYFQVLKERYAFKEHSRIRLDIYISTTYIHTHAHLDLIV